MTDPPAGRTGAGPLLFLKAGGCVEPEIACSVPLARMNSLVITFGALLLSLSSDELTFTPHFLSDINADLPARTPLVFLPISLS